MNLFKWLTEKIFGEKEVQPKFTEKPRPKGNYPPPPPQTQPRVIREDRQPPKRDTSLEDFAVAAATYGAVSQDDFRTTTDPDATHNGYEGFKERFGGGHYSGGGSGGDYGNDSHSSSSSHDYGSSRSSYDSGSSHSSYDSGSSSSYDSGSSSSYDSGSSNSSYE